MGSREEEHQEDVVYSNMRELDATPTSSLDLA